MVERIENIQEKMYDFEINKRNNLLFYGIKEDRRETPSDLLSKVSLPDCFSVYLGPLVFPDQVCVARLLHCEERDHDQLRLQDVLWSGCWRLQVAKTAQSAGCSVCSVQAGRGQFRGVQGPGRGAEEGGAAAGEQHPRDGGHVAQGEGEQAGAQEVHEGGEESQPGQCVQPAVRHALRGQEVLQIQPTGGQSPGTHCGAGKCHITSHHVT